MELTHILHPEQVYLWSIIDHLSSNPTDKKACHALQKILLKKDFDDKKCFEVLIGSLKTTHAKKMLKALGDQLTESSSLTSAHADFLLEIKETLETILMQQSSPPQQNSYYNDKLTLFIDHITSFDDRDNPIQEQPFKDTLLYIARQLKDKLSLSNSQTTIRWDLLAVFLMIQKYDDFFKASQHFYRDNQDINLYFKLYFHFIRQKGQVIYFQGNQEESVALDPFLFPDTTTQSLFYLLGIDLPFIKEPYIICLIGENFMNNDYLEPILIHEIGHLLDINFLGVSHGMINRLMGEHPTLITKVDQQIFQWVREIVADAIATILAGPIYLLSLLNHFNHQELQIASLSHPSLFYRINIIHEYLHQNNLLDILTKDQYQKLIAMIQLIESTSYTKDITFVYFEKAVKTLTPTIYFILQSFFQDYQFHVIDIPPAHKIQEVSYIKEELLYRMQQKTQDILQNF